MTPGPAGSGAGSPAQDRPRVVVGVDGSEHSYEALEWAMREAEALGALLDAKVCWSVPVSVGFGMPVADGAQYAQSAELVGKAVLERVSQGHPGLQVQVQVVEGAPAPSLTGASRGAVMLVVGSRGFGGFRGLLLGSVSQYCASHAHCPVLVVRSRQQPEDASDEPHSS